MTTSCIRPLAVCGELPLELVGGKARGLGMLMAKGFRVPTGFCLTSEAYHDFVRQIDIAPLVAQIAEADLAKLGEIAAAIERLFMAASLAKTLQEEIRRTTADLCYTMVAVRSSAMAEDLANASFAGQQETLLGVKREGLFPAIQRCWASLWSAPAMSYRRERKMPSEQAAMAVAVQQMVAARAAGVCFSINPLTGHQEQVWIEASYGLGESVVAGRVNPDQYLVWYHEKPHITQKTIADKAHEVCLKDESGTEHKEVAAELRQAAVLQDAEILEVADRSRDIQTAFGMPQDIEWAYASDGLFILQSRPVTATGQSEKLDVVRGSEAIHQLFRTTPIIWSNFNVRETMPFPLPMLSWSLWNEQLFPHFVEFLTVAHPKMRPYFHLLDRINGKMYWNFNILLHMPIMGKVFRIGLRHIDAATDAVVRRLDKEGLLPPVTWPRIKFRLWYTIKLGCRLLAAGHEAFRCAISSRRMQTYEDFLQKKVAQQKERSLVYLTEYELLHDQAALACEKETMPTMEKLVQSMGLGLAAYAVLQVWCRKWSDIPSAALVAGLPGNPTTDAAFAIWELSVSEPEVQEILRSTPSAQCQEVLQQHPKGQEWCKRLAAFLAKYGHRAPREFDLACPRWNDQPAIIIDLLKMYLKAQQENADPREHFQRQAKQRQELAKKACQRVFFLWRPLFRLLLFLAQKFLPHRETPKHLFMMFFQLIRRHVVELGKRLSQRGVIADSDDIYHLTLGELEQIVSDKCKSGSADPAGNDKWQSLVRERKEQLLRYEKWQAPLFLRSDGMPVPVAVTNAEGDTLVGTGVSCGKITARARVISDFKESTTLQKGEILVAPVTDPGWTPLFLVAAGLVMEVGGTMSHGAVVAREYGIPAVVSVEKATSRIHTGDMLSIDGFAGTVKIETVKLGENG
jgi:pyruvate,water dikinase